jgi:hypothetical protein
LPRKPLRRPSATAIIACLALLLALGGTVYAAKGSKISGNGFKKSSIPGNRFKRDTVTGKQVKEATLTTVPGAEVGNSLEGEKRFDLHVGFGASQVLFTAGPFTFTASCLQNASNFEEPPIPNLDIARILISTSENHTLFDGFDAKRGENPADFLDTTTPEKERVFDEDSIETGKSHFDADSAEDGGAYSDNGTAVSLEEDGVGLAENIGGPGCVFIGTAMIETR